MQRPFLVIATQNPIDMDGTFPLPEAQLDRFLMKISVGYPDRLAEESILRNDHEGHQLADLAAVTDPAQVTAMIADARRVHVSESVIAYIVALTDATRRSSKIRLGASPRGGLGLLAAARVVAAAAGRNYVLPDDVTALVGPVLTHRLMLAPEALAEGATTEGVLTAVVGAVPIPQG